VPLYFCRQGKLAAKANYIGLWHYKNKGKYLINYAAHFLVAAEDRG
jgi:hypothetical protein